MHWLLFASIVTVWAVMIIKFSNSDGVALYTLNSGIPNQQLIYTPTYPP